MASYLLFHSRKAVLGNLGAGRILKAGMKYDGKNSSKSGDGCPLIWLALQGAAKPGSDLGHCSLMAMRDLFRPERDGAEVVIGIFLRTIYST